MTHEKTNAFFIFLLSINPSDLSIRMGLVDNNFLHPLTFVLVPCNSTKLCKLDYSITSISLPLLHPPYPKTSATLNYHYIHHAIIRFIRTREIIMVTSQIVF